MRVSRQPLTSLTSFAARVGPSTLRGVGPRLRGAAAGSLARVGPGSLLAASLLFLGGCPMTNKAATDSYARQVSVATMRVAQLEGDVASTQQRVAQVEESMRAQGSAQATRLETVDQVNTEVGRIRGDIEVLQHQVADLKQTVGDMQVQDDKRMLYLEARVSQLESFLNVKPPPPPAESDTQSTTDQGADQGAQTGQGTQATDAGADQQGTSGSPATGAEGATGDQGTASATPAEPATVEGVLETAATNMKAGRNGVARALLEKAAQDHPGDPKLDEVRYRIAETYFNENDWRKAIGQFNAVIEGWPKSKWAPWAMLAQGDAFGKLGQGDNAKLFYSEVIRVYPKSDAAKEAKKQLQNH